MFKGMICPFLQVPDSSGDQKCPIPTQRGMAFAGAPTGEGGTPGGGSTSETTRRPGFRGKLGRKLGFVPQSVDIGHVICAYIQYICLPNIYK